jgi:hypothetical protein
VIAQPPERVAEPEGAFPGDRPRRALVEQPDPGVARFRVPLEPVESEAAAVARVGDEGRRRAGLEQGVEIGERAVRLVELERDPAELMRGVQPELAARIVLLHLQHQTLHLGRLVEAHQRLGEPVTRLADLRALGGELHRLLEHRAPLLQLVALVAGAPTLDQLGGHPEQTPHRVAGQEARRRQRRDRALAQVPHERGGRELGHALRRGRQRHLGQRDRRLVERRDGERHQRAHVGRRQHVGDLGARGGTAQQGEQRRHQYGARPDHLVPPGDALGAAFLLGAALPGVDFLGVLFSAGADSGRPAALTAASRSFAQAARVLSGLLAATS